MVTHETTTSEVKLLIKDINSTDIKKLYLCAVWKNDIIILLYYYSHYLGVLKYTGSL